MRGLFSNRLIRGGWMMALMYCLAGALQAENGLLYEISRPGLPTSYLLGTMHSGDPAILAMSERVAPQLAMVDRVVLEMALDADTQQQASLGMMLPEDTRLSSLVADGVFRELTDAAREHGLPLALVERLKPWAMAVTLSLPPRQKSFLDEVIADRARHLGKPIVGLESVAEQLAVFDAMPLPLQLNLLRQTLNFRSAFPQQWRDLQDAYLASDLDLLQALGAEQMAGFEGGIRHWFSEQVVDGRSRRMRTRLLPLLEKEACFIAVGALHLPGPDGLLAGLRGAGFDVRVLW